MLLWFLLCSEFRLLMTMISIKSDILSIQGYAVSMIGGRQENQDDWGFIDTPLGFLLVVCDGMGGGPGGKTASRVVKTEIARALCDCNATIPCDTALRRAAAVANEQLERMMKMDAQLVGMGSTFVAVLINRQAAYVAHAGDSRCYQFRGKRCLYRSQDHSLVAELVRKKALTEEEARVSPQSNVISRGLGSVSNNVPDIDVVGYRRGDRFVLCTDGVWGVMPHKDLLSKFNEKGQISAIVNNISMEVDNIGIAKGGMHDNHTLAIIEVFSDSAIKSTVFNPRLIWIVTAGLSALMVLLFAVLLINRCQDKTVITSWSKSGDVKTNTDVVGNEPETASDTSDGLFNLILNDTTSMGSEGGEGVDNVVTLPRKDSTAVKAVRESRSANPFDSVYIYLDDMENVKEKEKSKAVKNQDRCIEHIERYLNSLAEKHDSLRQGVKRTLLNVFAKDSHQKKYKYMNQVMEKKEGKEVYYIPTVKAKEEIMDFRKRVDKVSKKKSTGK